MPKTKRTKPSKKTTTKGNDLPASVKWLLEFVNLGCKPGVLNRGKVFEESSTLNRPPSEPGTPTTIHSSTGVSGLLTPSYSHIKEYISIPITKKKSLQEIFKTIFGSTNKKICNYDTPLCYRDKNGNDWLKYPEEQPIFIGASKDSPTLQEFRDFFSKTGIIEEDDRVQIWCYTNFCLGIKINNIFEQDENGNESVYHLIRVLFAEAFVTNRYDKKQIQLPVLGVRYEDSLCNGLKYSHDNTLSQVACAYILDFWHNH